MLFGLYHHTRNAHTLRLQERVTQQRIDFLPLVDGRNVVGAFQIDKWNVGVGDEAFDFDRLRGLWVCRRDFLVCQHDILAVFVLDTLDNVFLVDFLAGSFVDPLVPHRVHAAPVEPVEIDRVI